MRRIAFFTSTRAEYGLLRPLMAEVAAREELTLQLIVSGTHLSEQYGETWREIVTDGFPIHMKVDMQLDSEFVNIASSAALALKGTAEALAQLQPDVLVLLGDRYELLAAAQAAVLSRVPIAHIHGGEATEGAIDDSIRHALTKLSHWHFAAAEPYADRIRQMGESGARVWNVGAPAMDNISKLDPVPLRDLEAFLGVSLSESALLVTYHPVTLEQDGGLAAMHKLLEAIDGFKGAIIITGANADPGSCMIRAELQAFADRNPGRVVLVESLGARRYLSLMSHVDAVVGNSSSGLLEAPAIGVPTVDIGPRQQGRLRAPSVLHCGESAEEIRHALAQAISPEHRELSARRETPYGSPGAARRIVDVLQDVEMAMTAKPFVDLRCTTKNDYSRPD
ncbi:UDP-N-acetylglucosamine 2-epimerase [Chromobacterium alticapitis]|uniref:UDP-N-acetylglucosamine 2-epimerase n=1 Tax=Chromobacterium alticapitis TaxID=2073169 RepID=UPI0018EA3441|nr:UDP-N-acetylglucosamine 2-epimerase [Chromobacterium alticapitis]